mmetsp:Transcript_18769/g.48144  ORF Transcript_18769/g.48144 Transcript_18769/m.48144 type:complete len:1322 (+) Transcript_18769:261-4226(+)
MAMGGYNDRMLFEYGHAMVHPHVMEQVSAMQFHSHEELLWVGTERGGIHSYVCPSMDRYTSVTGHTHRVQAMAATPGGVLSISANRLRLHSSGGLPLLSYTAPAEEEGLTDMLSCEVDMAAARAIVGRKDNALALHDLATGRFVNRVEAPGEVIAVRYPAGRGLLAAGCLNGSVALCDPRSNYRVERTIVPHAGGLTAMDAKGDLLATAGLHVRMGQLVMDSLVQVYDIRGAPRAVFHIPFAAGPTMLHFQPKFTSMLMVGSASGIFTVSDVQGIGMNTTHQLQCEGDMAMAASISSCGEMTAFGTAGGYLHLWASSETPRVNHYSRPTAFATLPRERLAAPKAENLRITGVPQHFCMEGRPFSSWDPGDTMAVGLPPRVVDPSLLKNLKQVDFVGYVGNPKYSRSRKPFESSYLTAGLRNQRVRVGGRKLDKSMERAYRGNGPRLPARYHKMEIRRLQSHVRFEDFDFGFYNRTKFAGLENNLANCYCNPLMQVLFFIPMMREYLLQHQPDPDREHSLTCETSFLFRMLHTAARRGGGGTCQAANLLRSLRQSREASMLGLLEGHKNEGRVKSNKGDIEVETNKERSLSRRVQSLSRFMLEHLHREVVSPGVGSGGQGGASLHTAISAIFGMEYRQRLQCLAGAKAEQQREGRSFQVELQYPPPSERPGEKGSSQRPSFASLLVGGLRPQADLRAWFDEKHGYQMVRQMRVPTALPQVMVVNCGMQDRADVAWWQPWSGPDGGERPWLPWAIEVETRPSEWAVSAEEVELAALPAAADACRRGGDAGGSSTKAIFVLTALIVHVQSSEPMDEDMGKPGDDEGHVVALLKVPPSDFDPELGLAAPSPQLPRSGMAVTSRPPALVTKQSLAAAVAPLTAESMEAKLGSVAEAVGDAEPSAAAEATSATQEAAKPAAAGRQAAADAAGHAPAIFTEASTPSPSKAPPVPGATTSPALPPPPALRQLSATLERGASVDLSPMPNMPMKTGNLLTRGWAGYDAWDEGWLIHNDFCIVPCDGKEVMQLYGQEKVPCLIYYTRLEAVVAAEGKPANSLPVSQVLDAQSFHNICSAPPLQGVQPHLHPPTFTPLDPSVEPPRKGMLLAIDAEFVMFSPEEKVSRHGVEAVTRGARLGLARISVLRGDPGPSSGGCCIDDYVRTVEPVYDYLTRFSGLVPGDLDPSTSAHYLTTLKRAYMKLRYLVDAGCVFIGHGLKQDFRMINITVPPEQVIDTVELFYFKRHRKLGLRFLAAFLLGIDIQQLTHDSIEDARTALRLYECYKRLDAQGRVHDTLTEIYDWGKQHGWEPTVMTENPDGTHSPAGRSAQ